MWGRRGLLTVFLCLSWDVPRSGTFNIETEGAQSFHGSQHSHFGEKVAQFQSGTETWMLVSAPLEVNQTGTRTGRLYKCSYSRGQCQPLAVNAPPEAGDISLGLSLSTLNVGEGAFLACGPTLSHACGTNLYLNGVCYLFNGQFEHIARYPPRTQDCFTARVDLALLIDGSGSIVPSDFTLIKEFILHMLQRYRQRDVQFAVMQFSDLVKKEFNFEEYEVSHRNQSLVERIRQLTGDTYTPTAIRQLVEEIFVEESGLRRDSKRVMVVITDGKSNDPDTTFSEAIGLAQRKDILRFAVGVGPVFQSAEGRMELELIASNNTNNTVFSIQNFNALKTIQEQLQAKIFAIEGSQGTGNFTVFQREMAQEGFSSILTSDTVLLGTPGADGWTGGMAFYHRDTERVSHLTLGEQHVTYRGYSAQKATRGGHSYLVVGAPRDRHTGKVVIFKQAGNGTWEDRQHIAGEQIGSYFGSELGAMDVNGDGDTDVLLIAAPLHQQHGFGGKVQVCTMSPEGNFSCGVSLWGAEGDGLGRFGSAVAVLRDLNGDEMADVAVGAPLEDGHRGRVYIFHGERGGINPQYSQCLRGMGQSHSLRYFGCSVTGEMDVSGDQLTDLAIGSLGTVTVFRSRPVVTVSPRAVFRPQPIPMSRYRCRRAGQTDSPITNLTICFYMHTLRAGTLGELSANLTYRLVLDFGRQHSRVTFQSFSRELTTSRQLSTRMWVCEHHTIHLTACVKDYLQPVSILLNFTIAGEEIPNTKHLRPIMDQYRQTSHTYKLPFELDCGADGQCVDFLRVSFHFPRGDVLLIGSDTVLRVSVQLENAHHVSDRPQLHFQAPGCLTFRKVSSVQPSNAVVGCSDVGDAGRTDNGSLSCDIDHPTFPQDSRVTFQAEFDISDPGTEQRTANFTVTATSGNAVRITNESSLTRTLFLRYTVRVVTSGIESTRHINVTRGSQELRLVKHSYQVENLGDRSVPIGVMLTVPGRISGQSLWNVSVSPRNQTHGSVCSPPSDRGKRPQGNPAHNAQENVTEDCGIAPCILLRCDVSYLRGHDKVIFDVQGELRTQAIPQKVNQFKLVSKLRLRYDEDKYVDVSNVNDNLKESMIETEVELLVAADNLLEIVAGSVAGLLLLVICCVVLYKVGFFKRKKASGDKDQLQEDSPPATEGSAAEAATAPS